MAGSLAPSRPESSRALTIKEAKRIVDAGGPPRTLAAALDRIADLEECVAQLFEAMRGPSFVFPNEFNLTPSEEIVLRMLLSRSLVTREQLLLAVYGFDADDAPEPKIFDVWVCRIRPKVEQFDVKVHTKNSVGWYMTPTHQARLRDIIVFFGGMVDGN